MFKKISVAKARSGRKSVGVFTEDLERRNHRGIPQEIRNDFVRGISNPGFKAEVGETAFEGDLLLLGLGSRDDLDTAAARKPQSAMARKTVGEALQPLPGPPNFTSGARFPG